MPRKVTEDAHESTPKPPGTWCRRGDCQLGTRFRGEMAIREKHMAAMENELEEFYAKGCEHKTKGKCYHGVYSRGRCVDCGTPEDPLDIY